MISATGIDPGMPRSARLVPDDTDSLTSDAAALWLTSVPPRNVHTCWLPGPPEVEPSIDGEFSPLVTGNCPRMVIPVRTSGDVQSRGPTTMSGREDHREVHGTKREGK
ncbi:hypothetical protein GCM10011314_07230 [Knoellia flava]|uniref:Uncharacterized protein n=1 Tax=Knoellia flava TaxID=913969 RepID=A0A8H9FRI3_9MICO|nr:hypothetical protein GCM10011314_07230 [Knoellia flava]